MNSFRKFTSRRLVVASHNFGKIQEISALLAPFGVDITSAAASNLLEPEEIGTTYFDNALIKARACGLATNLPSLGDDSGLELHAFNGRPGLYTAPYTAHYGGRERVFAMWESLPGIRDNPQATFVCVQVLVWPDGHYERFDATVAGRLTFPPRGNGGHGYDPIFIPDGHNRTVAEMSLSEKNACSHRFLALQKLIDCCINLKTFAPINESVYDASCDSSDSF